MGDALDLGAALSAFSAALGILTAGSRMLFAFSRDARVAGGLASVSAATGIPTPSVLALVVVNLLFLGAYRATGIAGGDVFLYLATMGTLTLLVAYIVTNVGAISFLFVRNHIARRWEIVLPLGAIAFLGYTLMKQLVPAPPSPFAYFPYVVAAWLGVGLLAILIVPGLARRLGEALERQGEDIAPTRVEAELELLDDVEEGPRSAARRYSPS
jgi:amino acid transporter